MKGWQWVLASWGLLGVVGLVTVLAAWAGMTAYPYLYPAPEIVQPTPIVITVEKIVERVVEVPVAQPTAIPQQVSISIPVVDTSPTPVPEVEGPEKKCTDAASLSVSTPYFKTWKPQVTAEVVVFNTGDCDWTDGSHYIRVWEPVPNTNEYVPGDTMIPAIPPGGFAVVSIVIQTRPGLSALAPTIMNDWDESLTPQMQMDAATGQPAALEQFDYAEPQASIPGGVIIINFPTKDWEGLQLPIWMPIPGLPGWWYLKGKDGRGYYFPGSEGGGCKGGG